MSDYIYDFYNEMMTNNLVMIYEGEFTQDVAKSVLSMAERNFDAEGVEVNVKKKIFNVMVETLQNICKHQQLVRDESDCILPAIFLIGYENDNYHIITGNAIDNSKIELLKSKIDRVNSLDKDGLKKLYKEARLNSTISDVGGAGLGFIDIARKSGNGINYHFSPLKENLSFVTIEATVNKINKEEE
jgi:hypothetical protein